MNQNSKNIRTISFVDHLTFEYSGNIFSKAITVGDVDNDECNELALGTAGGDLYIYKGRSEKCTWIANDLGMITCLVVGDMCNVKKNYLAVATSTGQIHIFRLKSRLSCSQSPRQGFKDTSSISSSPATSTPARSTPAPSTPQLTTTAPTAGTATYTTTTAAPTTTTAASQPIRISPVFTQHLSANCKTLLIADTTNAGVNELIIGYTDRTVRSFKWIEKTISPRTTPDPQANDSLIGHFIETECWALAGQIGSMSTHEHTELIGVNNQVAPVELMVSQPEGTYVSLLRSGQMSNVPLSSDCEVNDNKPRIVYHPLGVTRSTVVGVTSEVIGNISRQRTNSPQQNLSRLSAICTQSGTLTIHDNDNICHSFVCNEHKLFALHRLDITGNGIEEVIACSWDGQTYIINLEMECLRFPFEENVVAFVAGRYSVDNLNLPCLIYATFNKKIIVYYNVELTKVGTETMISVINNDTNLENLLNNMNFTDDYNIVDCISDCLYNYTQPIIDIDHIEEDSDTNP